MRSRSAVSVVLKASTPAEARRPLLEKSRDAFAVILAEPRLALQVALEIELCREIVRGRSVEGALGEAERAGRALRKTHPHPACLGHQRLVRARFPDPAPL